MRWLSQAAYGLSYLFYPRLCEGCRRALLPAERVLCLHCLELLPRTQHAHLPDNEATLRVAGRFPFVAAASFAWFTGEGLLQHLLHGLKYKGKKETGIFLGRQFAFDLKETDWVKSVDLIVPIPLHPRKEAARGYNQSALIAEGMSEVLGIPWSGSLLQRVKHTENMEGAFVLRSAVDDRHLLLLDDVLTTGATLESCARTILAAAGSHTRVSIATIALAV
jgi:ComF family protein